MQRPRYVLLWIHVIRVENRKKYMCNYCSGSYVGDVDRIKKHMSGQGKEFKKCSKFRGNEKVHNNITSTVVNPHAVVPTQGK